MKAPTRIINKSRGIALNLPMKLDFFRKIKVSKKHFVLSIGSKYYKRDLTL